MRALMLLALLLLPAAVRAAGDVQAVVTDNVLEITGDDGSNVLRITGGTAIDEVVVSGVEATTVNGGAGPVTLGGIDAIRIVGDAGDDRVELLQLELRDRLFVNLGRGSDGLVAQDVRVRGRARIKGGRDRDDITIRGFSRFTDRLVIETGRDPDAVTLTNVGLEAGLRIGSGGGGDTVLVQFCELSAGEELIVRSGDGEDAVTLLGSDFLDDVDLDLGAGDDDLLIADCDFDQQFEADGGDGDDEIDFDGNNTFDPLERRRILDFEAVS